MCLALVFAVCAAEPPAVVAEAAIDVRAFGDCTGIGYIEGAIRGAADVVARLLQSDVG